MQGIGRRRAELAGRHDDAEPELASRERLADPCLNSSARVFGYHRVMNNLYFRAIPATIGGFVWFFAVIFIPAWTLAYWQGWAFFLTISMSSTLATIYIALHDKKLLESRLLMGPSAEKTLVQKIITSMAAPVFVAVIVVMVFDHRFGWSPVIPAFLSILGDALAVFSCTSSWSRRSALVRSGIPAAAVLHCSDASSVPWTWLWPRLLG